MEALTSRSNWNLEVLVFVEGRKPVNPEKNPRGKARTNKRPKPHETASTGHRGRRRLSTAPPELFCFVSYVQCWLMI